MDASIETIDQYIDSQPNENTRDILKKIRKAIKEAIPNSSEKIGYGIPTFTVNGRNAVHFGGYEKHIGLYPGPLGIKEFEDKLKLYKTSKGTIQFPLDKPIPYDLIRSISKFSADNITNK